MSVKYHALRSALIVAMLPVAFSGKVDPGRPTLDEQILEAIKNCIAQSPAPWPEQWKREYIETIHSVISSHQDSPCYAERLEILRKGFGPYWKSFEKTTERSLFEVYRTRIRWYVEHLMGSTFSSEKERQRLRDQFTDIWNYAADSLLEQFPFLDPNAVEKAKADNLNHCYQKIDAPLMPVYLRPMSEEQVEQIKQLWDKLRYIRVDLWRHLDDSSKTPIENRNALSSNTEHYYELTKESLSQLVGLVWMIVPKRPKYYLEALENRSEVLQRRFQKKQMARSEQQRMEEGRSRQLLQIEHISFLFSSLLEMTKHHDITSLVRIQKQSPLEQQDDTEKGGDSYGLKNGSH